MIIDRINKGKLENEIFDLIIIGGGINGCGIAREASGRGLKVLLLEKEDYGAGCTAAPTRLIHGGLRYLEYFDFKLVKESLLERELLLKNANHLVKPLKLTIPIYKGDKNEPLKIKAGMFLYDLFSFFKSLPSHKMVSKEEFTFSEPNIQSENLLSAAVYYDAQVLYPERICLENILMAKSCGALAFNHATVTKFSILNNEIDKVYFKDSLSNLSYSAKGKLIINVSGPWVDSVLNLTGKTLNKKIGGTKGSHIFIRKNNTGPKNALYVTASDGRPFFIIPFNDYYLIGTTDIPYDANLDELTIGEDEINYLIGESNRILKNYKISKKDVLFTYVGVRPLPYEPSVPPAKKTRRHILYDHESENIKNLISIIGGKLTTYRSLSEEVIDYIFKKTNYKFIPSKSKHEKLLGALNVKYEKYINKLISKYKKKTFVSESTLKRLVEIYGKKSEEILTMLETDKTLNKNINDFTPDILCEFKYSILHEDAYTISDLLLRRIPVGLSEDIGESSIEYAAQELKTHFNYDDETIKKQISDYKKLISLRKVG